MVKECHLPNRWRVKEIVAIPAQRGVRVTFVMDGCDPVRFLTREFGCGPRKVKAAALARFASKAGFGEVEDLFHYLLALPKDQEGDLFPLGPVRKETPNSSSTPDWLSSDYDELM